MLNNLILILFFYHILIFKDLMLNNLILILFL